MEKGDWSIVLTKRTHTVNDHKGQVSFPGGACDPVDCTIYQTALREAREEIGLRGEDVCVVGRLMPFETRTTYRIHPVVGIIPCPYSFHPSRDEVERVFTIPLTWLADPQHRTIKDYHGYPVIYYDLYDGELLWGISASITVHLIDILSSE
jgi:8-oxo-dGTP pyrophosphatase MutT (NUDIX family)